MVKLQRAQGECLGTRSRRRTQQSAICYGESKADVDPWISEWGNPAEVSLSPYGKDASIAIRREPPELKHLSRARKRNQPRFRE